MRSDSAWAGLYRSAAWAARAILVLLPIQIALFIVWPPPTSGAEFLQLFATTPVRGVLDADLLYLIDLLLNALVMLAVGVAVWREQRSWVAPALGLLGVGTAVYVANNPAFSFLVLSRGDGLGRLGAAELAYANYQGIANGTAYTVLALGGMLLAIAVLRSTAFSRATAVLGIAMNVLMLVPSGAGSVGMVMSLTSLVPFVGWLWLVSRKLMELSGATTER